MFSLLYYLHILLSVAVCQLIIKAFDWSNKSKSAYSILGFWQQLDNKHGLLLLAAVRVGVRQMLYVFKEQFARLDL